MTESHSALLPVVLVGAGTRARSFYAPLLRGLLADRFELVGLVARSEGRVRRLAEELELPWALSLEEAKKWGARGAVVAVSPDQNHAVADQLVDLGLPALLETPLALDLEDAGPLLQRLEQSGLPFELAEQNPRHLGPMLWTKLVRAGHLGQLRAAISDGQGYRYHATAVARSLFGRSTGLRASALRVSSGIDLGRGTSSEPLYMGSITVRGGGLFQMRASEVFYCEESGWVPGPWTLLGDRGSINAEVGLRVSGPSEQRLRPFEWQRGTNGNLIGLAASGVHEGSVEVTLPGEALDDDEQAVARCLLDWLARLEGVVTDTAWSPRDGYIDLQWIASLERSALLAGAPLNIEELKNQS